MRLTRRSAMAAGAAMLATPTLAALPAAPRLPGVRLAPDREQMVAVPGGRVYLRVNGRLDGPRPPIVLIHGGPGSSHWYFLNATALAGERAVILYDQLDSGRSDTPDDPANWRVARFVDELAAIKAALGIQRWHVLGASWGGTVALEYGATRPAGLASLILQSPLVSTAVWLEDARQLKQAMPAGVRDLLDRCDVAGAAPPADCDAATAAFYARHVRLREPPAEIAAYRDRLPHASNPAVYNAMWGRAEFTASGTLKDYDGRPLLKRLVGRDTLFLAGAHDEARPQTVARLAAQVPGATFREVPDAAHSALNDNPAAYLALLRPWLAAHDGRVT